MKTLVRPRCPVCGHRVNLVRSLKNPIRLGNDDIILQQFAGRARIRTLRRYGFDTAEGRPYARCFLEKIKVVQEMLANLLGELPTKISRVFDVGSWQNGRTVVMTKSAYDGHLKGSEWS